MSSTDGGFYFSLQCVEHTDAKNWNDSGGTRPKPRPECQVCSMSRAWVSTNTEQSNTDKILYKQQLVRWCVWVQCKGGRLFTKWVPSLKASRCRRLTRLKTHHQPRNEHSGIEYWTSRYVSFLRCHIQDGEGTHKAWRPMRATQSGCTRWSHTSSCVRTPTPHLTMS
jgi:hypothetical protein